MGRFELAAVINGRMNKEDADQVVQAINEIIAKQGGTGIKIDDWGKRRLAYEIQKMREGYYYFISFVSEDSLPSLIEKKLRINEDVIRFLIVKVEV